MASLNLPELYEDKEDLQILEEVLSKYKVSAIDMNTIKKHLINAIHNFTIDDLERLTDRYKNVLNPVLDRYEELKYNLVTNGKSVKTGRKVNGKDEWVVLKTVDNVAAGDDRTLGTSLPTNCIIHDYEVKIVDEGVDLVIKSGLFLGNDNFFSSYAFKTGQIHVKISSGVNWVTETMKYYVTLYYTVDEVIE